MLKCPESVEDWTLDEVAECLEIPSALSSRLWSLLSECKKRTPLGGDGTNGTVEYPDARRSMENDDKLANRWNDLTESEQQAICMAAAKRDEEFDRLCPNLKEFRNGPPT